MKYSDKMRLELKKLLSETKIFSVTGISIREAVNAKDLEDNIFKRIAPEGIVISKDKQFQQVPDVISHENILEMYKETTSTISTNQSFDYLTSDRYMTNDKPLMIIE